MFALQETIDFAYSNYWLLLAIGAGMGGLCLAVAKVCFGHKHTRRSFRRGGNPMALYYAEPNNTNSPRLGWIFDRSVDGVGLNANEEIAAETVIAIRPVDAPAAMPWVEVEVRWCRPCEYGFEVGCKFVCTPPWPVQEMYG